VIGAGAAGLAAAIAAAAGPAPVVLLERTADGGHKILISGGGRCNVLPSTLAPERFVTDSPAHLLRGMLRAWPLPDMVRFFEQDVGIPLALEPESGKLFPRSNRARDIRDGLVTLAARHGVLIQLHTKVDAMVPTADRWTIATSAGPLHASRVIIATGGLSVPATGSDGFGLNLAQAFGHRVHEPYAALTPLTHRDDASPLDPERLAGVSLQARLRARTTAATVEAAGGFLFTHRGYSGPAVLDVSHACVRSDPDNRTRLRVAWSATPPAEWEARLQTGDRHVATLLARELPERLAHALLALSGVPRDRRTSALTRSERLAIVANLTACELGWTGHEGYKKAEVTGGGVALDEVDPKTLESRRTPGLYFCGEVLDAFGPIGGHNFAWAWSTGRAAGMAAARAAAAR
jgi:predicted Rossmann fold flavoprotein